MLRVTVLDTDDVEHVFSATGPHEDYEVREDPWTGEVLVEHVTYAHRGLSVRARTGSQVVAAWPAGTWRRACVHSALAPSAGAAEPPPAEPPPAEPPPAEPPPAQPPPERSVGAND